jgi:ubiquinone/menaquinone biosynthesis C-methylase UbiE
MSIHWTRVARYDTHVDWYDEFASTASFVELRQHAVALLGPASGRCLDLGCGTGLALPLLDAAGWKAVGVEVSQAQLTRARERGADVLQADAHELPFEDASFDAVVSILTHTDFDDARAAFAEAARVLRSGGLFVYAGVHPVFASPFALPQEDGTTVFRPGYRTTGWHTVSRYPDRPGIRSKVGVNHIPLAALFNAVLDTGLILTRVEEPREEDPPLSIALRAEKR